MLHDPRLDLPVLSADRFDLRPVRTSDAGLIEFYTSDERVARATTSIPHPLPPGATEAFIDRVQDTAHTEFVWVMDGTKTGGPEVMGVISLDQIDVGQCEISYWVAPAYWNSGVASAAVATLIKGNPLKCRTLFATVFQDNAASARVLTNNVFQYLGDAETFNVARNAKVATWTYSRKMD